MKLSEKYFNAVIRKINTSFSAPKAIEQVQTYGQICRLEEALDIYQHLIGLGEHHYDEPTLFHMKSRRNALRAELRRIAKRENIKA